MINISQDIQSYYFYYLNELLFSLGAFYTEAVQCLHPTVISFNHSHFMNEMKF